MPDCPTCNRPVYFGLLKAFKLILCNFILAERVTSIGKDWHRPCLRCYNQACKKTLSAGGHSEVSKTLLIWILFLNFSTKASLIAIVAMEHCSDLAGEKFPKIFSKTDFL